jgi:predicted HAD superfamily Cof-like phosphohydrolase
MSKQHCLTDDVREFHHRIGDPAPKRVTEPSAEFIQDRKALIMEEARELCEALDSGNIFKIAREAVDLAYVAIGVLVAYNLPFIPVWRAVHKANMAKSPKLPGEGKPRKPEGWVSPDREINFSIQRRLYMNRWTAGVEAATVSLRDLNERLRTMFGRRA